MDLNKITVAEWIAWFQARLDEAPPDRKNSIMIWIGQEISRMFWPDGQSGTLESLDEEKKCLN